MKVEMEGMYLNIIKAIYDKPIANIILNREKLKPFPKVMNKISTRMSTISTPIQHTLEFLDRAIRKEEEIKGIQIGKEEVKLVFHK
jgi:hypothetical protein